MKGISDFYRGDTRRYTIKLTDQEGRPVSVDGCEFVMTFKTDPTLPDDEAAIQVVVTGHEDDPSDPKGEVVIVLDASITRVDPGLYYYDIQMKTPTGEITTLLAGTVQILQDVTHRV